MGSRRPKPLTLNRRCLADDAVRASRLRHLIERCVVAGLAPPNSHLGRRSVAELPLFHPNRGCADVALARHVAMYLAHVVCGLTYTQAARLYGRDRTTAAYGCRHVEERRDDPMFDRILELLERCVGMGLLQIEPRMGRQATARLSA